PTAHWITDGIGKTIIDNYWQTETGWPVLALMPGLDLKPVKFGSPGLPTPGYHLRVIDEATGKDVGANEKGVLVIVPPLPPGCMTTVWNDDARFLSSYFSHFKELLY
ncbi:AMP-binding protein, partial [Lysobacter sp. 2RAB21]